MLIYENSAKGFNLYYHGRRIISHTTNHPFLEIGNGSADYSLGGGVYKIKETSSKMNSFRKCTLIAKNLTSVTIGLENNARVIFSDESGLLVIRFEGIKTSLNRLKIRLAAESKEHIYGCGEQYTHLDMRGRKVPLWIEEQGIGRGHDLLTLLANVTHSGAGGNWHTTYYSQPTFISSANYFVHSDSTAYALFDFTKRHEFGLTFWQIPEQIFIGVEEDTQSVFTRLTALIGRQPALPDWAYDGVWLGVQGGNTLVRKKYEDAKKAHLPVAALWAQDWEGRRITSFGKQLWWNWHFDEELYPALPQEISAYRKEGVRYLGYINPFLALEKELYAEASKRGFLVKGLSDEESYVKVTTFPAALIDLTNPEAFAWIKSVIKKNMIDIGLSGWMADFAEWMPIDSKPHSGENPELLHNKYAMLWAKANYEAVAESGKLGEIAFFSRSGYTGSSRYATALWAGDQMVNFSKTDGLATVIVSGISFGFNGIGISHSDIGGYTSVGYIKRTKEVFMRWAEQAAFTPIMRTHESNRPDSNWQFNSDEETLSHFAKMAKVHVALKPYLKNLVEEYTKTGMPPIRQMYLHYPHVKTSYKLKYQYLFGADILVAPIINANKIHGHVYIPEGTWVNLWDGKTIRSGRRRVAAPIGKPPVFYRADSSWKELFLTIKTID